MWHKSTKTNKIEVCTATIRKCPYPLTHFENKSEIEEYLQTEEQGKYHYSQLDTNLIGAITKEFNVDKNKATEALFMFNLEKQDRETWGLSEPPAIYLENIKSRKKKEEIDELLKRCDLTNYLAIVENEYYYYVWTNNSFKRDVIVLNKFEDTLSIMKSDKSMKHIEKIEVKNLVNSNKSAQLSTTVPERGQDICTEAAKKAFDLYDVRLQGYSNSSLGLTEEESYDYIVKDYLDKGTSQISLKKKKEFVHIKLLDPLGQPRIEEAKKELKQHRIKVDVKVRGASQSKKVGKEQKEQFLKEFGVYFKDGKAKETFKLSDFKNIRDESIDFRNDYFEKDLDFSKSIEKEKERIKLHNLATGDKQTLNEEEFRKYLLENKSFVYIRSTREAYRPGTYDRKAKTNKDDPFIKIGNYRLKLKSDVLDLDKEYSIEDFQYYETTISGQITYSE